MLRKQLSQASDTDPETLLSYAIDVVEAKCRRIELLMATESGPQAQYVKDRMQGELTAMRIVLAKAKDES